MSMALPGTERNLTKLNAPITATPVPMFPFTSIITTCTITGRSARVIIKLFVFFCLKLNANAIIRPSTNEAAVQKINSFVVIAATVVSVVVTVVAARIVELSTAYHLTFMYFFRKLIKIRSSVF